MDLTSPDDPYDFAAPVALGVIGLGMAGAVMVHAAARHPGIRIVAAADPQPGPRAAFMYTMRSEAGLLGTPGDGWDVGWAAAFLASDEARWITGATLPVESGGNSG